MNDLCGRDFIEAAIVQGNAFPSLALGVTILGLNLLGHAIRDVLDPRMRL